ncbi:MAG TPA: hypothetical protein VMF11_10730 [Candidatus Baltobacteraceae bacterium]|nr:hypothetical protein [Candidatus Baltobacteraceae bacterium]
MLLRTIFLLAFLAVLSETIVQGASALAQAALRQRALDASRLAFVTAEHAAQAAIAQGVTPAPIATCAYAGANGCEINVQTTFATPAAAPSPSACPGTACTVVLQNNSAVSEGRAVVLISSVVSAASGAQLAARSGLVAFRTFATPPYASIVGGADGSFDALIDGGPGDDAGAPNTLITVQYTTNSGSTTAGNVWQPLVESPPSAVPGWDH